MTDQTAAPAVPVHGDTRLPSVGVDSYNVEIRDDEGLLGDRITSAAFREVIDHLRKLLRKQGEDPLGDGPTEDLSKKTPGQAARGRRARNGGSGAERDRGFRPGACAGDPPLSKPEGHPQDGPT